MTEIILSVEQELAFNKYIERKNIFITGPGGSGKTKLIRHMYNHSMRTGRRIQVCALTGCAAVLLECSAKTIHSWAGIGLGDDGIGIFVFVWLERSILYSCCEIPTVSSKPPYEKSE